jgi:hypothetical protein
MPRDPSDSGTRGVSFEVEATVVAPWQRSHEKEPVMPGAQNPRRTRTRRLAQLLMGLLIEAGRGTVMLAPIITPLEDDS